MPNKAQSTLPEHGTWLRTARDPIVDRLQDYGVQQPASDKEAVLKPRASCRCSAVRIGLATVPPTRGTASIENRSIELSSKDLSSFSKATGAMRINQRGTFSVDNLTFYFTLESSQIRQGSLEEGQIDQMSQGRSP